MSAERQGPEVQERAKESRLNQPSSIIFRDHRSDVIAASVSLYKAYVDMVMKQYDLIWVAFKLYAVLMAGALSVAGFVYKGWMDKNPGLLCPAGEVRTHLLAIAYFGAVLSVIWFFAHRDHWKWERVKQGAARQLEKRILALDEFQNDPKREGTFGMFDAIPEEEATQIFSVCGSTIAVVAFIGFIWGFVIVYLLICR